MTKSLFFHNFTIWEGVCGQLFCVPSRLHQGSFSPVGRSFSIKVWMWFSSLSFSWQHPSKVRIALLRQSIYPRGVRILKEQSQDSIFSHDSLGVKAHPFQHRSNASNAKNKEHGAVDSVKEVSTHTLTGLCAGEQKLVQPCSENVNVMICSLTTKLRFPPTHKMYSPPQNLPHYSISLESRLCHLIKVRNECSVLSLLRNNFLNTISVDLKN